MTTERFPYEPKAKLLSLVADGDDEGLHWQIYCAGFNEKGWRKKELAMHLISWLPAIVLHPTAEPPEFGDWSQKLSQAARHVFATKNVDSRGEIGEILLHIICRQNFRTYPTIFKLFYKTASNDVVKGFDLIHTNYCESADEIEIWLGESKFYKSLGRAITDAVESINTHLTEDFLDAEKALVGPKINPGVPGYEKLKYLLEDISVNASELKKHLIIPIFVTFNLKEIKSLTEATDSYTDLLKCKLLPKLKFIKGAGWFESVRVKVFAMPLGLKDDLVEEFSKKLELSK
jgi:hypothetical protein